MWRGTEAGRRAKAGQERAARERGNKLSKHVEQQRLVGTGATAEAWVEKYLQVTSRSQLITVITLTWA